MQFRFTAWQLILLGVICGAGVLLAGCGNAPPTPMPLSLAASATAQGVAEAPTITHTADPTATLTRTPTPTLPPTLPPTSTPTPSPTNTSTPTPSPTWTPSPTPEPSFQLETAHRHQINGDYELAIGAYLALLQDKPTPAQAREARYRLAETYQSNREYVAAAASWEEFLASYGDDARLPQASLMAARAYHAANECVQAVPHYQAYLAQETVLADLVQAWIGDCLVDEERLEEAVIAYRRALEAAEDPGARVNLRERIAGIYLAQEEYDAAVAEYDAIPDTARLDFYRAKIEYLAGQALAAAGRMEDAHVRYRRAVDNYPEAEYAYLSLIELVDAGVEVDEFQRGLVDYHAGAAYPDAYGAAIAAFDRYVEAEPAEGADAALYYRALALRALEQPEAALETLEALIEGYPESEWLAQAWREKGATHVWMGDNEAAVKAYQDLAAFFPADELAPIALWRAARLREREGAHEQAADRFEEVQASFPAFEDADEALWRAGLAHYRMGDPEQAILNWQSLLESYALSPYRDKTLYWLGKLGAKDESVDEGDYWEQLVAQKPQAYYALRVEQIRAGDSLTATRLITAEVQPPGWDRTQAEAEILPWLQDWTTVPTATKDLNLPGSVTGRTDLQRGEALLSAGMRLEALGAFDSVRAEAWKDPLALAQLSLYFREQGLHGLAARSAYRLAGLWPEGTIQDAPEALQRLAYPLVYADLLSAGAQERELDPLLLAALVRQESLFEPVAESYAGARGLGQVMPATGQGIANSLGLEDFVLDDLYRPSVSITFGAFYLGAQMNRFDDLVLVALAAYNGGPGNTLRWVEAGGEDLDLFVEVITATQSRLYLQRVYEQYLIYERLYRSGEGEEE
jgi:soluble lytic murein transglycosylase